MKVTEHLDKAKKPLISFEILPLNRGGDINQLFNVLDDIIKYDPPFIDVTSHSAQVQYDETPKGIKKKVKRKRPGTIGISVAIKNKYNIDTVESKVFGIGAESYTVGSNEFYLNYAATKENVISLMDAGHYHPTEVISDKIPAMLVFNEKIALHVSRPVRWDSDHVIILDDELKEIVKF